MVLFKMINIITQIFLLISVNQANKSSITWNFISACHRLNAFLLRLHVVVFLQRHIRSLLSKQQFSDRHVSKISRVGYLMFVKMQLVWERKHKHQIN